MINNLINLANALDEAGFEKEANRVDALIKDEAPLFVYGTLRKGEKNHKKLKGAEFLGEENSKRLSSHRGAWSGNSSGQ